MLLEFPELSEAGSFLGHVQNESPRKNNSGLGPPREDSKWGDLKEALPQGPEVINPALHIQQPSTERSLALTLPHASAPTNIAQPIYA